MKKDSLLREPYRHISSIKGAWFAIKVVFTELLGFVRNTTNEIENEKDSSEVQAKQRAAYDQAIKEMTRDDGHTRWINFIRVYALIQTVFLLFTIISLILGSEMIVLYGVFLLVSTILLAYRPWMMREKRIVPFGTYLLNILDHPRALISILNIKMESL